MEWQLFSGIPGADVRAVLALARRSTYRRGEVVFHRHDPADSVHLVVKGRFDIRITTSRGDVVALAIKGPGDIFGELAILTGAQRSATVTALEAGETLVVRGSELRRLARDHPSVDEVLVRVLAEEVAFLSERLVEAYTVDAEARVARRVLELGAGLRWPPPVVIPLIQEDLAALAGASRATVNRLLREAEARGLVELGRGRTVLLDPDGLARLARSADPCRLRAGEIVVLNGAPRPGSPRSSRRSRRVRRRLDQPRRRRRTSDDTRAVPAGHRAPTGRADPCSSARRRRSLHGAL